MSETLSNPNYIWPDKFDFETDKTCQTVFKPFIEAEMAALANYDDKRPSDITYIFHEHAQRVATAIKNTALQLGLGQRIAGNLYWAALPHDIGKQQLPIEIWDSEEKPDEDMKRFRRTHTLLGAQKVQEYFPDIDHPFKDLMIDIMVNHHEHMDGSGTHGLTAPQISAPVRLASIVESYDGYRIWRPHFKDRDISPAGVLHKMRDEDGKGATIYDMTIFTAFEDMTLGQPNKILENQPITP